MGDPRVIAQAILADLSDRAGCTDYGSMDMEVREEIVADVAALIAPVLARAEKAEAALVQARVESGALKRLAMAKDAELAEVERQRDALQAEVDRLRAKFAAAFTSAKCEASAILAEEAAEAQGLLRAAEMVRTHRHASGEWGYHDRVAVVEYEIRGAAAKLKEGRP